MLDGLRKFMFGERPPPIAEIPREAREAHHRLLNTAMIVKQTARQLNREADELIDALARDLRGGDYWNGK